MAIKEWGGAVCIISHSTEFVTALCPEIWHVDNGELQHRGKVALVEDAFDDPSRPGSRSVSKAGTPRNGGVSRVGTPGLASAGGSEISSAVTSANNSGAEDAADGLGKMAIKKPKKKKVSYDVLLSLWINVDAGFR
jgi:elongation factor 3